ncbi:Ferrochelatase [Nymphon striatum]|nr:Ferrochelatase [Nymphon striatum]
MKKLSTLVAMSVSALALSTGFAAADYTLNILHINDLHSRIEPINRFDSTCGAEDDAEGKCFGGIARNVLLLDAGDQFQGSLFYTTYKGDAAVEFMNSMGFDAMFIDSANFPVISGNTLVGASTGIEGGLTPYVVKEIAGEKVAIVSVLASDTAETSSPGAVAELEGMGINKIIVLSHVGLARDKEIAASVDGIDVIVGGHSAADTYPVRVQNPSGADVPIVQAYAYSKYLGELRVTFDDDGNVLRAHGEPHLLDSSPKLLAMTTGQIEGNREVCRAQECSMGNLVADAMLDRVKGQGVQIAIQNGGGLRASIDSGEITMGEVLTVLPFQNTLATFEISGEAVVAALENGVSRLADGAGRFPQVSGMSYTFDAEAEVGSRVSNVKIGGEPIDLAATYKAVSNNFMRGGGDGYSVFTSADNAYDYAMASILLRVKVKTGMIMKTKIDRKLARTVGPLPHEHPPVKIHKVGVLLINLGTPDGTDFRSMRRYLQEFLTDKRVIEWPKALWYPILYGIILNVRPGKVGKAYAEIWNNDLDESYLRTYTRAQSEKLGEALKGHENVVVDWAMRYGQPSIDERITALRDAGCDRIVAFPLYPHYSAATTATVNDKVFESLMKTRFMPSLRTVPSYHDEPIYIEALARSIETHLAGLDWEPERVIASYHGIPESYFKKGDPVSLPLPKDIAFAGSAVGLGARQINDDFPIAFWTRRMVATLF